jgi:hypothetical protein
MYPLRSRKVEEGGEGLRVNGWRVKDKALLPFIL